MSPKFPAISVREITRVLKKMIFFGGTEWKSSKMERPPMALQVIVPAHGTKIVPIGTLKSIIDGSGLDVSDFQK